MSARRDLWEPIRVEWSRILDECTNVARLCRRMGITRGFAYDVADGKSVPPGWLPGVYFDATGDSEGMDRLSGHRERDRYSVAMPEGLSVTSVDDAGFELRQAVSQLDKAVHLARADGQIDFDEMAEIDALLTRVHRVVETKRIAVVGAVGRTA